MVDMWSVIISNLRESCCSRSDDTTENLCSLAILGAALAFFFILPLIVFVRGAEFSIPGLAFGVPSGKFSVVFVLQLWVLLSTIMNLLSLGITIPMLDQVEDVSESYRYNNNGNGKNQDGFGFTFESAASARA